MLSASGFFCFKIALKRIELLIDGQPPISIYLNANLKITKENVEMLIFDLIDDRTKQRLKAKCIKPRPIKRKQKKKTYSVRQLEELMGTHRDRYHKISGKVKKK